MSPPPPTPAPPSPERTLGRLFLTLFLRGRTSRNIQKGTAPKSIKSKLALTLVMYALFGLLALVFVGQPLYALSVYLHAMTLVFLGMFVASSAGEVLFNKEEADILMHRPITPRALLLAKVGVLVRVSLWLAGAFNLAGLFLGVVVKDGGWLFPIVHAVSTTLAALFCTACVVLMYQLCLRWFGRERLDNLMTTAQVLVAVAAVIAGQMVPQLIGRFGGSLKMALDSWWIALLPPAWFAGFDDALAGRGTALSWILAGCGVVMTGTVVMVAFGKLAQDYQTGLQNLNESVAAPPKKDRQRRWLAAVVKAPPLSWWLQDSVTRAGFVLTAVYLFRDRDVKLRVYPGLAPNLVMPLIFLIPGFGRGGGADGGFGVVFSGVYLGMIPLMGLNLLRYSQQWQASDIFRIAPMPGPGQLCHGARQAVLFFLAVPALLLFALLAWLMPGERSHVVLLLPGIIALPIYSMIPCLRGKAVPFSLPTEEAKSAGRGLGMIVVMVISMMLSGLALWAWMGGWFKWLLIVETIVVSVLYQRMRASVAASRWLAID
jgi:ABC-2 type transport system permease protein